MVTWLFVLLAGNALALDADPAVLQASQPEGVTTTAAQESPVVERQIPSENVTVWLDSVVLLVTGPAWCGGVFVDEKGTVATAYHCIAMGGRPRLRTHGGVEAHGRVIATDPKGDLALVAAPELAGKGTPRPIREEPARPGEEVWALGHPFAPAAEGNELFAGLLQWSVSHGVVSAVGERLVQVDAGLNPGNSGGPVLDAQGRILGVASRRLDADNVAFMSPSAKLTALMREAGKPHCFGGTWGLGFSGLQGLDPTDVPVVGARVELSIRDRLVAEVGFDLPIGSRWTALESGKASWPAGSGLLAARLRVGSGKWSTAFDAGGGVLAEETLTGSVTGDRLLLLREPMRSVAVLMGRVTLGGAGLRLLWEPAGNEPRWLLGVDLDWPGVLGTF